MTHLTPLLEPQLINYLQHTMILIYLLFIEAETLGMLRISPYERLNTNVVEIGQGINFVVVGATPLDSSFHEAQGIHNPFKNASLGGNDYNHPIVAGKPSDEIKLYVPFVTNTVVSALKDLIDLGAQTLVVSETYR
ncbi:putative sinapine esterase [Helianthus anomalus]